MQFSYTIESAQRAAEWRVRAETEYSFPLFCAVLYDPLIGCSTETSSSAVAERPRDASCMSVASFNSTVFSISYFGNAYN